MKLLILDRDGVINEDSPDYIKTPEEWQPIAGSLEAIGELSRSGWTIVVATNQSAIGRKMIAVDALNRIHAKMHRAIAGQGGHVDAVFFCPHGPDAGCVCRKPNPGMILDISSRFHIPCPQLTMVGDSQRDLQAIAAVGGKPVLVRSGNGIKTEQKGLMPEGTQVFDDLAAFAAHLLVISPAGLVG